MIYNSTRGELQDYTASQAIIQGLAPDGGLYVPCHFPALSLDDIRDMAAWDYQQKAARIFSLYLTDYAAHEIRECVDAAYNGETFFDKDVTPLRRLQGADGVYMLELWHGASAAFKDVALQVMPKLFAKALHKRRADAPGNRVLILVATSGDTGKAALEGFRDVDGIDIAVFYPVQGVSQIQKLQMVTQRGKNVHVAAVRGNFDDAQTAVKSAFNDAGLKQKLQRQGYVLSSANSINFGRLLPQIVYYFQSYCELLKNGDIQLGEKINFVVPTGNFGNILAAYYAMKMGLPINKLICASNSNNVLTEFINTGVYDAKRKFYTTHSPSMDILISSNLERLLFDVSGRCSATLRAYMDALACEGRYRLDDAHLDKIQSVLWGGYCGEDACSATIHRVFRDHHYVLDPHTAVAVDVCGQYKKSTADNCKTVVVSTASAFKFPGAVLSALEQSDATAGAERDEMQLMARLSQRCGIPIPVPLENISTDILFKDVIDKNEICNYVLETVRGG